MIKFKDYLKEAAIDSRFRDFLNDLAEKVEELEKKIGEWEVEHDARYAAAGVDEKCDV